VQKTSTGRPRAACTLVISDSPETLDGLTAYFNRAGVSCESRRVANPLAGLPAATRALVVFPDDFPSHQIASFLAVVGARRPELTLVIVTRNAAAYVGLRASNGRPLNATVLPKPAFGWAILDVIRAALGSATD
jgi:hypothetical protein